MTEPASPAPLAPSTLSLRWSGITDRGKIRANNEDSFLALTFEGPEMRFLGKFGEMLDAHGDFVFAVSDGMGGARSGEFASKITVEKIARLLPASFRLSAQGLAAGFADYLHEVFTAIHADLLRLGQSYEECEGMGTTLSLCWFTPGWMYFGHIGDSRIYYLPRAGGLRQITHDHSHVGWLRRQGRLSEREARMHPMRNSLHQALGGSHQFVDPQIGSVGFEPGDRFLLCSDGLIDGLWDHHLEEFLRTPDARQAALPPAPRLVAEALDRSGRDNITAVVVECLPLGP